MTDYRENLERLSSVGWPAAGELIAGVYSALGACSWYTFSGIPVGDDGSVANGVWVGQTSGTQEDCRGLGYGIITFNITTCVLSGGYNLTGGGYGAIAPTNQNALLWFVGIPNPGWIEGEAIKVYPTPGDVPT